MKYMLACTKNRIEKSKGGFNVTAFNMSLSFNSEIEKKKVWRRTRRVKNVGRRQRFTLLLNKTDILHVAIIRMKWMNEWEMKECYAMALFYSWE